MVFARAREANCRELYSTFKYLYTPGLTVHRRVDELFFFTFPRSIDYLTITPRCIRNILIANRVCFISSACAVSYPEPDMFLLTRQYRKEW